MWWSVGGRGLSCGFRYVVMMESKALYSGLYERRGDQVREVAPLLSVGMAWPSGRAVRVNTHHGSSQAGALVCTQLQSRPCYWNNLCVRLGRESFCLHFRANGFNLFHTKELLRLSYAEGKCFTALGTVLPLAFAWYRHLRAFVWADECALTMMTSRIFWKSFLKPSVELQNRAKFPSRSCREKHRSSSQSHFKNPQHTAEASCAACQVNTGQERKRIK